MAIDQDRIRQQHQDAMQGMYGSIPGSVTAMQQAIEKLRAMRANPMNAGAQPMGRMTKSISPMRPQMQQTPLRQAAPMQQVPMQGQAPVRRA